MKAGVTAWWGLTVADFRERVRRPAYLVMLISAVGLGWLAVPPTDARWVVLDAGGYRGLYTSAYVGLVTALTSALWLTFVGFYLVRDAVARDVRTGVGQLLAAGPLRTPVYLAGKFTSNLLVLGSMAGVLAVTALVLQLLRGESRTVDPVGLMAPFVFLALPMLAVTAAAALLFETTPVLRSGFGNMLWCFVWMAGAIGGQSASAPLGGIGVGQLAGTMPATADTFGLGLMYVDRPLRTFEWSGLPLDAGFVAGRVALTLLAVAVALLPALWFHRFDVAARSTARSLPEPHTVYRGLPPTAAVAGSATGRLLAAEVLILVRGTPWWWWAGAAVLAVAGLAAPPGPVLAVVWIWPVLLWSRLGTRDETAAILAAYPAPRRRLVAEWAAGVLVAAAIGALPAVRMLAGADLPGLAAWTAGALFIPALALALGTLTGVPRTFQALYTVLWYMLINDVAALDFMGALPSGGPPPAAVAGAAVALFALAFGVTRLRHARR
ncbi:ABC transporter permease [Dactylosporangium cerinum]